MGRCYPPGRLEPVHPRHANVHEHDVGPVGHDRLERARTVAGLRNDNEFGVGLNQGSEPGPHDRLVVRDDDSERAHSATGTLTSTTQVLGVAGPTTMEPP